MAPTPYNQTAWSALTEAAIAGQKLEALLLEYEPDGKEEKLAWGFLINPSVMEFKNSAQYGEVSPHATTVTSSQYSHSTGQTFTTPSMSFALWCHKKSAKTLLDGLKSLLEADPQNDRFSPPLLRFVWGSFSIGPLSLMEYSYKITAIAGGEPTDVSDLSLTFKEQPRPLTQAEQEERSQQRLQQQIDDRAAQGAPNLPLTERQQEEAKARAQAYLERNIESFSADVQSLIRDKSGVIQVNPETGLVTLQNAGGDRIATISQFDGNNHKISRTITSIPLAEGGQLTEGAIQADGAIGSAVVPGQPPPTTPAEPIIFRTTR